MDKEVRLKEEIAHYLVKAHNNDLKFRADILKERANFVKENWGNSRVYNQSTSEEKKAFKKEQKKKAEEKKVSKMSHKKQVDLIRSKQKSTQEILSNLEHFYRKKKHELRLDHSKENLETAMEENSEHAD